MKRVAVYSCITGGYDSPRENQPFFEADFTLFTDNPPEESKWTIRPATNLFQDSRRNARYHKLLSHLFFPEYDYTIWIDGRIEILCKIDKLIEQLGDNDILTCYHPERKNAYDESVECARRILDDPETVSDHMARMRADGFPDQSGLAETKIVVRRNNDAVTRFNREWFYQLMTGSLRDQLSFNYAVWKTGVKVVYMNPLTAGNTDFAQIKHLGKREYGT